jgi:2-keto-4-pentenoate hydratase/2-oxohepta-3-ene-1,7-dioic acid hydratase in catechol pathway
VLEDESVVGPCQASEDLGSSSLPGGLRGLIEAGPSALAYVRNLTGLQGAAAPESSYRLAPEFLKPGALVEAEIQGIGAIRNRIVEAATSAC